MVGIQPQKYGERRQVGDHILKAVESAVRLKWECQNCGSKGYNTADFRYKDCK